MTLDKSKSLLTGYPYQKNHQNKSSYQNNDHVVVVVPGVRLYSLHWESKNPPWGFLTFFPNGWEFLDQILHTHCTFISSWDCKCLSNYLQFWRSYAILTVTNQFTPCSKRPPSAETHAGIFWHFPKQLGIFGPNFTVLLRVPIYARLQMFIQLSKTLTKLCRIKHKCQPIVDILSI